MFKELLHSYCIIQLYMTRKRTTINETRPDRNKPGDSWHILYIFLVSPFRYEFNRPYIGRMVCLSTKENQFYFMGTFSQTEKQDSHHSQRWPQWPCYSLFRLMDVFFLLICRLFVYLVLLRVFCNLIDFFVSAAHKRTPNSVCGFVANQSNKHINFRLNFSCICIGDQDQGQDQDQSVSTTNKSQVRKDECNNTRCGLFFAFLTRKWKKWILHPWAYLNLKALAIGR